MSAHKAAAEARLSDDKSSDDDQLMMTMLKFT